MTQTEQRGLVCRLATVYRTAISPFDRTADNKDCLFLKSMKFNVFVANYSDNPVTGRYVNFPNVSPIIKNGRTNPTMHTETR